MEDSVLVCGPYFETLIHHNGTQKKKPVQALKKKYSGNYKTLVFNKFGQIFDKFHNVQCLM